MSNNTVQNNSQTALQLFGQLLMNKVRDEAITDWKMIIDGRMKDEASAKTREILSSFTIEQRAILQLLIPEIVDTVLHHLLWALEQQKNVHIRVTIDNQEFPSLKDISDGLPGELYTDDGWIARFSKEKVAPT